MSDRFGHRDHWRWPTLVLWFIFFLVGLVPEPIYWALREWSGVLTQDALVNSSHLLTLVLAGYVAVFAFHRCLDAGMAHREAQDRSLQLGVISMVAFLPVPLDMLFFAHDMPLMQHRASLYFAGAAKFIAWWFLMYLFVAYYAFNADDVFARIPSLFPSTRRSHAVRTETPVGKQTPEESDER